jgi:hypothetical protein
VGRHTGDEQATQPGVDRKRLFLSAAGLTATLIAWGLLVWLAIDFGTEARSGSPAAWLFVLVATAGATGALFLGLVVGHKALAALRGQPVDPKPPRAPRGVAGKRAAR